MGGAHSKGSIFRINRDGHFETLYSFDGSHGSAPMGGLVQANDGNFYGTTEDDGVTSLGAVYKMTPTRQVMLVYKFRGGSDGAFPRNLVLGSDGNLYGTSLRLNVKGGGVLFREWRQLCLRGTAVSGPHPALQRSLRLPDRALRHHGQAAASAAAL